MALVALVVLLAVLLLAILLLARLPGNGCDEVVV